MIQKPLAERPERQPRTHHRRHRLRMRTLLFPTDLSHLLLLRHLSIRAASPCMKVVELLYQLLFNLLEVPRLRLRPVPLGMGQGRLVHWQIRRAPTNLSSRPGRRGIRPRSRRLGSLHYGRSSLVDVDGSKADVSRNAPSGPSAMRTDQRQV